jgi:hypothetical protein
MMLAPAQDVKDMLEDATWDSSSASSLGLIFKTNLFVGKEPTKPINCVTLYDTPGFAPYLGLNDIGYEYPSIQVRVRNDSYENGWVIIERIKDSLHGRHGETWNGTLYTMIACSTAPALLEWDDNGNAIFFANFNLQRRP